MAKEAICALLAILEHFFEAFSPLDLFFVPAPFRPAASASLCFPPSRMSSLSASAHPVSSSIPTYSISRPSAQVNIIPAWFPSLSETPARAVFIFRALSLSLAAPVPACAFMRQSVPVSPRRSCRPRPSGGGVLDRALTEFAAAVPARPEVIGPCFGESWGGF